MDKRAAIKNFIEEKLLQGRSDVDLAYDDDLLLSGLINSLGVMRLVDFAQDTFDVDIPASDITIEHFATIDDLATYVESRPVSQ